MRQNCLRLDRRAASVRDGAGRALLSAIALGFVTFSFTAPATADPAAEARAAMAAIEAATEALDAADSGRDRIAALTETVRAFEDGLAAIRVGQRAAAQAEDRLTRSLAAKEDEVSRLIGALQIMSQRGTPQMLLHPSGPTGAARSSMLLSDVTPALQAEVAALRADLADVSDLRALQADAAIRLTEGLVGVEEARAALSRAIADRTPLPTRFTEDPIQIALLIAASETLDGFAAGLARVTDGGAGADAGAGALPSADALAGTFELPVRGTVLRRFGEADAAGISRPGLILATEPAALVTAPSAGTVRFEGPLLDYGNVMILEPARDVLLVLAGLEDIYVSAGDVITTGAPLGLMGAGEDSTSSERSETLYIEVRVNQEKADPEEWFALERN
ncbi:MAG: peptidoglycan DD-metalloendopeptidase family protein [Pseudomonadota bacterium]